MKLGTLRETSGSLGDAATPASRSTGSAGRRKETARIFPRVAYPKGKLFTILQAFIDQCSSNVELQ